MILGVLVVLGNRHDYRSGPFCNKDCIWVVRLLKLWALSDGSLCCSPISRNESDCEVVEFQGRVSGGISFHLQN